MLSTVTNTLLSLLQSLDLARSNAPTIRPYGAPTGCLLVSIVLITLLRSYIRNCIIILLLFTVYGMFTVANTDTKVPLSTSIYYDETVGRVLERRGQRQQKLLLIAKNTI